MNFKSRTITSFFQMIIAGIISNLILCFLVICAWIQTYLSTIKEWYRLDLLWKLLVSYIKELSSRKEECSGDVESYAKIHGYNFEMHQTKTEDGHILTIHRIFRSESSSSGSFCPVL